MSLTLLTWANPELQTLEDQAMAGTRHHSARRFRRFPLERYAPDPVTTAVTRLAAQDEARHDAFGLAHLRVHIQSDPEICSRLGNNVRGLNVEVFDALILMAAGSWEHEKLREGHQRVMQLTRDMDEGRKKDSNVFIS